MQIAGTSTADLFKKAASIHSGASSYLELGRLYQQVPIAEAFADSLAELSKLGEMERFDLWHHANHERDRLAGINYDRARTYVLQNRPHGEFIANFYPEVSRLPARERIVSLASAHIGCSPAGDRQTNLFALTGYNAWDFARSTTTPSGTT